MARRFIALVVVALFLSVGFTATTAAAAPQTCTTSSHCYDIARVDVTGSAGFHGVYGYIHAACMYNSDNANHFSTAETWLGFSGGYWVEAGIATGDPEGARRYFFWADQRPGGGYHEHDDWNYYPDPNTN